jgi:hypothetical protein
MPIAICEAGGSDTYAWTFFILIVLAYLVPLTVAVWRAPRGSRLALAAAWLASGAAGVGILHLIDEAAAGAGTIVALAVVAVVVISTVASRLGTPARPWRFAVVTVVGGSTPIAFIAAAFALFFATGHCLD